MSSGPPEPPKIDPWEARERERERWNKPRRSQRETPRVVRPSSAPLPMTAEASENYLIFGILASVFLLLLAEIPRISADSRMLFAEAGTILALLLLGFCRRFVENMGTALRRGPNPLILLLIAWAGYAFFNSPYRTVAAADLMRIVSGAALYFLAAYSLNTTRQKSGVLLGVIGIGLVIALIDLAQAGRGQGLKEQFSTNDFSIFGTHGNVGSLLVLLVPLALSFALHTDIEEKRRLASLGATMILGAALLASRTRSAWIGAFVSFGVLAYLFLRYGPKSEGRGRRGGISGIISSPGIMITLGFLVFAILGGLAPFVSKRVASMTKVSTVGTFQDRLTMWNGAALMTAEKPLTGWGLGAYQIRQSLWTHRGDEPFVALQLGADQRNMAHNYYFQWAADTGGVGLALYGAMITLFLLSAFRGARETRTPFQMALLAGTTAAVAGALVDACASPAYHFHGVYAIFCLWTGMAISGLRPYGRRGDEPIGPALPPTPWTHWTGAALGGIFLTAVVLGWGYVLRAQGEATPRGKFEIIAQDVGPLTPGVPSAWTATFADSAGETYPTQPGTDWRLQMDAAAARETEVQTATDDSEKTALRSIFRLQLPFLNPPDGPVTVQAMYRDRYGRIYEAQSEKSVRK